MNFNREIKMSKEMIVWHGGEEVKTEGEIEEWFGGFFFKAIATNHPENNKNKIGKPLLMACYQHPEISDFFGIKKFQTSTY
jgi:hypothetical protein